MIISLMIGSGIFSFASEIHKHVNSTGWALIIWLVSGFLALTGALCYAELGTMIPGSGGEAQYLSRGFGPLFTYLFDWTSILILKPGTVSVMLISFSRYAIQLIKVFDTNPIWMNEWTEKIFAAIGCFAVTALSAQSQNWSNFILDALTWCKVSALAMIISGGAVFCLFDRSIFTRNVLTAPFADSVPSSGSSNVFLWMSKLVLALCSGLWSFEGWNNLNIVAGDLKNPKRNLPLAIWISVGTVLGLYFATLLAYYCVIPAKEFIESQTVGLLFGKTIFGAFLGAELDWIGAVIFSLAIMGSTFSAALSSMMTSSEIIILSANKGNIPARFGIIDKKTGTAFNAYVLQGVISILLAVGFTDKLLEMYTFPTWIFYFLCAIVVLQLRFSSPDLERPYRVWISTPILFSISCIMFMGFLVYDAWLKVVTSLLIMLAGVPVYYWYTTDAKDKKQVEDDSSH